MLNSYLKINERGQHAKGLHDLCFQGKTDFGYCAAKDMHYYGLKIGLRISRLGMIIHYCLFPTHSHDVKMLETIFEEFEGIATAEKNVIDEFRKALLPNHHEIIFVTLQKKY